MVIPSWPLGLVAALGALAGSSAEAGPRVVVLDTATPGGGFPAYGEAVAETINYLLARALHLGEADLGRRLPQARETTAANTAAAAPRRELIHPGVLRYLREIGVSP